MKAVVLKHREWERIFAQIRQDYAATPSVYLIREKMKDTLGFTWREHRGYKSDEWGFDPNYDWRDSSSQIHIDFYSESARTYFIMKYMNYDQS